MSSIVEGVQHDNKEHKRLPKSYTSEIGFLSYQLYSWFLKEGGNGKSKKNVPEPLLVQGVLSRHFV
jgi:hypothetical protein